MNVCGGSITVKNDSGSDSGSASFGGMQTKPKILDRIEQLFKELEVLNISIDTLETQLEKILLPQANSSAKEPLAERLVHEECSLLHGQLSTLLSTVASLDQRLMKLMRRLDL